MLHGLHAAFEHLRDTAARHGGATVVNLGSASAIYGQAELAGYSATKFYVRGLTEALDIEWSHHGIRVVDLWPLFVQTGMLEGISTGTTTSLGINLRPQDVADAVVAALEPSRARPGPAPGALPGRPAEPGDDPGLAVLAGLADPRGQPPSRRPLTRRTPEDREQRPRVGGVGRDVDVPAAVDQGDDPAAGRSRHALERGEVVAQGSRSWSSRGSHSASCTSRLSRAHSVVPLKASTGGPPGTSTSAITMSLSQNTWPSMSRSGTAKQSPCAGRQPRPASRRAEASATVSTSPVCAAPPKVPDASQAADGVSPAERRDYRGLGGSP